jgi:hypothetical protein
MRYWKASTVVRSPWSIVRPSPVFLLVAFLSMPALSPAEVLVVSTTAPSNPFPPHTLSAGYRDGIQSRPAQSDAESYRMGYAQANRILDRPTCEIPGCDCGCQEGGACRCLSAAKVATVAKPAPKKLTGDPRIDGGMWVRQCSNGRCTNRWVPLSELPEFARRPVMQVPEAVKAPVYEPQRRSLFRWR